MAATWQPSAIASCWHRTTTQAGRSVVPSRHPAGTGTLFGQTMGLVVVTAALFTVGAYLARNLSGG